jgi:hypothetical protein
MGKGWIVIILLLICKLDATALPSKEIQINISIAKLNKLIKKYNSINTFDKNLYAKRVQILKIIAKKAKNLYEVTGDIKFAKIHETYSNEAQDLIKRFYSQRDNAATEAKFRGRSKRILKPWQSSSQGTKVVSLTNFGNNLSTTDRNLGELSKLTEQMDLSSLMADKAANLHRMIPSDQNFQEFRGGGSLSFAPSTRDMDAAYVAPAPRRLAQQQRRDAME